MKLSNISIVEYNDFTADPVKGVYPKKRMGTVKFVGDSGSMEFELTQQDFKDIEELLLIKCKVLAGEA